MGRVTTVADLAKTWERVTTPGNLKTYSPYVARIVQDLGTMDVRDLRVSDLRAGMKEAQDQALRRRGHRNGTSAAEHYVSAARSLLRLAVEDRILTRDENPAQWLQKPRRQPSRRHALTNAQVAELWTAAASGGNDPSLDLLLLRLHLETGARRDGVLGLRYGDVRQERQVLLLREKGGTEREQPVSLRLQRALLEHLRQRLLDGEEVKATSALLRYRDGSPLTRRRYNTLFERLQEDVPWAGELGVTAHWLRHTATTNVERVAGHAVARRFAGHREGDVTGTYTKGSLEEVARAVSILTGEPHPLAPPQPSPDPW